MMNLTVQTRNNVSAQGIRQGEMNGILHFGIPEQGTPSAHCVHSASTLHGLPGAAEVTPGDRRTRVTIPATRVPHTLLLPGLGGSTPGEAPAPAPVWRDLTGATKLME